MLGQKIRELRESRGLVQRQIADALGIDTAFVSKVENGEKQLSKTHLKKIARLYSLSAEELEVLWLADKLIRLTKEDENGQHALEVALETLRSK